MCVPEFCPFPLDKASVPSPMALGGGLAHGRSGRVDDGDIKVCDGAIRVGKDEVGEVLGRGADFGVVKASGVGGLDLALGVNGVVRCQSRRGDNVS